MNFIDIFTSILNVVKSVWCARQIIGNRTTNACKQVIPKAVKSKANTFFRCEGTLNHRKWRYRCWIDSFHIVLQEFSKKKKVKPRGLFVLVFSSHQCWAVSHGITHVSVDGRFYRSFTHPFISFVQYSVSPEEVRGQEPIHTEVKDPD